MATTEALRSRNVEVTGLSRSVDGFDLTNEETIARALGALEGPFDLIFVATGALRIDGAEPEKSLDAVSAEALAQQYAVNGIGPLLVLKHARRLLPRDSRAVFAVLSARVGSIGDNRMGGWYGYRAAKAGVNQLIHGASIELARKYRHLSCVCLHPGTVRTRFTEGYQDRHPTVTADEAAQRLLAVIDGVTPEQTGQFLDYAGRQIPW
ncbi:SDR family oxidoreductase [Salipiger pallidus]|uniref:SDR family oxidoreductase n=1 Tax=Salipiger pallidus TaxID=1775170 RepID=A0A8J2ZGV7_9RHOB|nr:SDR family oxidoreductase [Salipiger pallidus]GGG61227.1 SDR family oxidoreductase [Salipiger pallidus]